MASAAHKVSGSVKRTLPWRRVSAILENCSRTVLFNPGAESSLRSVANCEAMGDRLSSVFPLSVGYERLFVRTLQPVDTQVRFHWPGIAVCRSFSSWTQGICGARYRPSVAYAIRTGNWHAVSMLGRLRIDNSHYNLRSNNEHSVFSHKPEFKTSALTCFSNIMWRHTDFSLIAQNTEQQYNSSLTVPSLENSL